MLLIGHCRSLNPETLNTETHTRISGPEANYVVIYVSASYSRRFTLACSWYAVGMHVRL